MTIYIVRSLELDPSVSKPIGLAPNESLTTGTFNLLSKTVSLSA